jgi:hypothetical protein
MASRRRRGWWFLGLLAGLAACSSPLPAQLCATSITYRATFTTAVDLALDLVFVIDDSAAMAGWQTQLVSQLPAMAQAAKCAGCSPPNGVHIGVVSSDLGVGAALNAAIPGCGAGGEGGQLRSQPEGTCTDTTLDPGATFISDVGQQRNFSTPDDASASGLGAVFQCVAQLGADGCGVGQPLAALERALGADGQPPPSANAGFLRPYAALGIVFITNRDDCSAAPGAALFSTDDVADGPLTHYRCNHAGHTCQDPGGNSVAPPVDPPASVVTPGGVGTLSLTNCESNESGELTPVSKFVADIKALKPDPDNQIFVAAIVGPPTPYAVEWVASAASGGAAWPRVAPSCGTEDADGGGSFGEPSVRLTQFATSFSNSVVRSICDADYARAFTGLNARLDGLRFPPCLPADLQTRTDSAGNTYPDCVVTEHLVTADGNSRDIPLPACAAVSAGAPCWSLAPSEACPGGGQTLVVANEPLGPDPSAYTATQDISCQEPSPPDAGCPPQVAR